MNRVKQTDLINILRQPLSKRIDQKAIEKWSASLWEAQKHRNSTSSTQPPFVMMFPPPNITGNLHLGHALTGAIQDALTRQRRMQGYHCIFIPGFDHAGLATQNIVEKLIWRKYNLTRQEFGRERFTEVANEWKEQKQMEMREQLDRLGLDLTHEKEYFTTDYNSSLAVREAFKKLFNSGLIYRSEKPIFWSKKLKTTLSDIEVERIDGVDRYVRTGEKVERRPLSQWFIDAAEMAKRAVDVVENGAIEMIPANYKRSWKSWLLENGVQDWCISRQSWWGHRIPAYKIDSSLDSRENWIVADSIQEAENLLDTSKNGGQVVQDPDVLDTWFSSSLLPLTVSGWPDSVKFADSCDKNLFPLHVMETGFDILTYWVSKMVMISLALTEKIPFKLVLLHGMICDSDGKKMSKSKGNVIDPLDVIDGATLEELQQRAKDSHRDGILEKEKLEPVLANQTRLFPKGIPACGADGLRAYLLSHDVQEEIVRVRIEQIEKIRRLSNKIWNIYRFAFTIFEQRDQVLDSSGNLKVSLELSRSCEHDQQVLGQLADCVIRADDAFNRTFQLQYCLKHLEIFWTIDLSQNYISNVRDILLEKEGANEDQDQKARVLALSIVTATKLLHPFMPHVTEFLYQRLISVQTESSDASGELSRLLSYDNYPRPAEWTKYTTNA